MPSGLSIRERHEQICRGKGFECVQNQFMLTGMENGKIEGRKVRRWTTFGIISKNPEAVIRDYIALILMITG
jgi:hypothetical protein